MKKVILLLCVMQQVCSSACQGMWTDEENWDAAGTSGLAASSCANTMRKTHDPDEWDDDFRNTMELFLQIGDLHRRTPPQGGEGGAAFDALLSSYTGTCQQAVGDTSKHLGGMLAALPGAVSAYTEDFFKDNSVTTLLACNQEAQRLRENFGYAYPTEAALVCMKDFIKGDSVLAVGSGSGFIEGKLQKQDVDIVATDIKPPKVRYMDIVKKDVQSAITSYPKRNVLLIVCWDPKYLLDFSTVEGTKIIGISSEAVEDQAAGFIPDERIWKDVSGPHPLELSTVCNNGEHPVYVYLYARRQNTF